MNVRKGDYVRLLGQHPATNSYKVFEVNGTIAVLGHAGGPWSFNERADSLIVVQRAS